MAPPSLVWLAQRACIRNIASLKDVGEISYDLVYPILRKIDNPDQLHEIEIASPHIADHDAELWVTFIARDIPNWKDKIVRPTNPRSWWKVYRKLMRDEEKAKQVQEEELRAVFTGIEKKKEVNQTQYIQKVLPEGGRQSDYVDGNRNPNARRLPGNTTATIKKPALKNAKTGFQILSAIRRDTAKVVKQRERSQALIQRPSAASQIKPAPAHPPTHTPTSTPGPSNETRARAVAAYLAENTKTPPNPKQFLAKERLTAGDLAIQKALRAQEAQTEAKTKGLLSGPARPIVEGLRASTESSRMAQSAKTSASRTTPPARSASPVKTTEVTRSPSPAKRKHSEIETEDADLFGETGVAFKAAAVETPKPSPSPSPAVFKRRPAPVSVFMPTKKRKV